MDFYTEALPLYTEGTEVVNTEGTEVVNTESTEGASGAHGRHGGLAHAPHGPTRFFIMLLLNLILEI